MKDYKVGDTVFVKGKITDVDHNETMLPYCVVSSPNYHFWASQESVIDELPPAEPVKPALPEDVADELETTKKLDITFDGYIMLVIDNHYLYTNSHTLWMNSDDGVIKILMDAWYNGYTIEKPKLYNLVLGKDSHGDTNAFVKAGDSSISYLVIDPFTDCEDDLQSDSDYQFTQEEIDKYNKSFWIKNIDLNDYKELVADD